MRVKRQPYGEELIGSRLPTLNARQYLNWFSMAGWHRCNATYCQNYGQGIDCVFVLVTVAGEGMLEAGGRRFRLTAGTVAVIPAGVAMAYRTAGEPWEFYWLNAGGPNTDSAAAGLWRDGQAVHRACRPAFCVDVLRELLQTANAEQPPGEMAVSDRIAGFFGAILADLFFHGRKGGGPESVGARMTSWLERHYAEPVTIDGLSRRFFLSANQLIRVFRARTGYTPYEYLKRYRLLKACEWLQSTELPVEEVGRRTGYANASHFAAQFKAQYGISPSAYRRRFMPGGEPLD